MDLCLCLLSIAFESMPSSSCSDLDGMGCPIDYANFGSCCIFSLLLEEACVHVALDNYPMYTVKGNQVVLTLWCLAEGFVRLYRLVENGRKLELVHKTALGGIPGALAAFKGRLLAGVGPTVRLYDLGKKKLLRKSEYRRYVEHAPVECA